MSSEEVIDKVEEICKKHSVSQVILFGSRAKNTQMERSDIDIAVSGAGDFDSLCEEIEDIWGRAAEAILEFKEEYEKVMPYFVYFKKLREDTYQ